MYVCVCAYVCVCVCVCVYVCVCFGLHHDSLEIDKWVLAGGSWGSTLALTYACCHADRVMAIVMFGILTCRK